ncbi:MAG: efflux RND transporter periplasmic adaptor subunit [Gemmatimonadales bacterium]
MNTTRTTLTALLIAAGIAAGCEEEEQAPVYQLIPVSTRDIVVSASAAGVIEPVTTVEIKSKASGEIMEVRAEVGNHVTPGQLLVKVDPRVPNNALRQAEADLDVARAQVANAESQLRRSEELFETQSITEQEYESAILQAANARAQLVRAERALEDARISFEDTDVRAPIEGTIIQRNIEVGTVISSAMSNVSGGAVLMLMANLDTVQVRALVDETDIGKIQPGMPVTITVEAYPNRPFEGRVLMIEPQATVEQNVTMFPVIVRIANEGDLLRPGMNAEVEVHVGNRTDILAVPNAALRTDRDVQSAAQVLGLDPETVMTQLADARQAEAEGGDASLGGRVSDASNGAAESCTLNGRTITPPAGVTCAQIEGVFSRLRSGGFQNMSEADRAIMSQLRGQMGRPGGGRPGGTGSATNATMGGNYVVFVRRNGTPTPVPIRTGLTDLDYSEVLSGLTASDTVMILPSASLIASQQEMQERLQRMRGGLPGISRQ